MNGAIVAPSAEECLEVFVSRIRQDIGALQTNIAVLIAASKMADALGAPAAAEADASGAPPFAAMIEREALRMVFFSEASILLLLAATNRVGPADDVMLEDLRAGLVPTGAPPPREVHHEVSDEDDSLVIYCDRATLLVAIRVFLYRWYPHSEQAPPERLSTRIEQDAWVIEMSFRECALDLDYAAPWATGQATALTPGATSAAARRAAYDIIERFGGRVVVTREGHSPRVVIYLPLGR